jgi:WD40 repeat protein
MIQRANWGLGAPQGSAFAADGQVLVQGTPFGIYLYQAADLQLIRFLEGAREFYLSPAGDLLFTRLADGSIQVIDLPAGETRHTFAPIAVLSPWMKNAIYAQLPADRPTFEKMYFDWVSAILALVLSPDGNLVAIGFGDASIGLWDLHSGALLRELRSDIIQDVSELVFSPDGGKLLSVGRGSDFAVWQVEDGQLLWRLPHIGHIVGQPFSADGSLLAMEITQGTSSWVTVRETRYGGELGAQVVGKVASQAISPDNTRLLTTWYGVVKIWSIPHLRLLGKIDTGLDWPRASFSTDGAYILMNEGEQAYRASDLSRDEAYPQPTSQPQPEVDPEALRQVGHLPGMLGVRYPQPDQAFAWGTASGQSTWVLDLSSQHQATYDFGSPFMADPDLSPDGDLLAGCTEAGLVLVNLSDGQTSNLGRCRATAEVRFSADGKIIFRANGTLIDAIDSTSGELLYNLRGHAFLVESLAVTNDGRYLLSASNFQRTQGREVIWWRLDVPQLLWRWMVSVYQSDRLLSATTLQDGSVVYTALGGLRAWRLGDGGQHHLDTSAIASLTLSPDNRLLATGDFEGNIHLFELGTWREVAVLTGHAQSVVGLAFSPDGNSLLSASTDGTLRLWGLP